LLSEKLKYNSGLELSRTTLMDILDVKVEKDVCPELEQGLISITTQFKSNVILRK
jgi:uncharacterized protein YbbK (DUF523 family)